MALHIEYLLLRHDCVILPGFGAFINARTPARLDNAAGMWHPMTCEVRFNSAVTHDDGLLANSYSRKYSLAFAEARTLLDSDIRNLKRLLDEDGEVTIGRLGSIMAGDENTTRFLPSSSVSRQSMELGMVPVAIRKEPEATGVPTLDIDTPLFATELDYNKNYYIRINKGAVRVAATLLVIIITAFISFTIPSARRIGEDRASVIPVKEIIDSGITGLRKCTPERMDTLNEPDVNCSDSPAPECGGNGMQSGSRMEGKYHLIVGTFGSEKEALKYISQNSGSPYQLTCVPSKTLCRVSAMSSDDNSELLRELNSAEFKTHYREGWIWESRR